MTGVYAAQPQGCALDWPSDYVVKALEPPYEEDPLAIEVLRREAEIGREVRHPRLVPILDSHLDSAPYFIVMPRIAGVSLEKVVERVGQFTVPHALWIVRQTAEALRALHEGGWIHADVKPANLVVSKEGRTTLIDLGCALREHESIHAWDRPVVGTLHYIAPEMIHSRMQTDCRSDIYSLGVSLYQMVTGKLPFDSKSQQDLIDAHLTKRAPDVRGVVPDLNDDVSRLIRSMLAKEPLRRPQNTDELIEIVFRLEVETIGERFERAA